MTESTAGGPLPPNPGKPLPDFLQAGDVLLVSYPRSGNTWMRYLLANLIFPGKQWHIHNIGQVIPDLGEPFPRRYRPPSPRIFKTHFPRLSGPSRAIYLYRDGRDAAISYHDRRSKLRGERQPLGDFMAAMLRGGVKFGSWQAHVDSWMAGVESGRVLAVCYEDMCRDLEPQMQRVGRFLGYEWTGRRIRAAARRSSQRRQRLHYRLFYYRTCWKKGFTGGIYKPPGHWREYLTADQQQLFWRFAGETAGRLGYAPR